MTPNPKARLMKKYLPLVGLLLLTVVFYAFRKQEVFVVVSGKVLYQGKGLESVYVAVVKDQNDKLDWNIMSKYSEPSTVSGDFRLQFNTLEGEPAFIYFMKPGYSVLKKHIITSGVKKKIDLGEANLINLTEAANISSMQISRNNAIKISNRNAALAAHLPVFYDHDFGGDYQAINPKAIKYFTKITRKNRAEIDLPEETEYVKPFSGYWYEVRFVTHDNIEYNGWIFQ